MFLETLIENKVKFLVFAHHYQMLDQLEDLMLKTRTSYIRIDGQIDVVKRHEAVNKFQSDPKCLAAILSLTASGQGITLTAATAVVFAEMAWTPGLMIQAEDRAHRIGQQQCVSIYYLYGEDTLDSLIYPRLRLKSEVVSSVVDGTVDSTFHIKDQMNLPISKVLSTIAKPFQEKLQRQRFQ